MPVVTIAARMVKQKRAIAIINPFAGENFDFLPLLIYQKIGVYKRFILKIWYF